MTARASKKARGNPRLDRCEKLFEIIDKRLAADEAANKSNTVIGMEREHWRSVVLKINECVAAGDVDGADRRLWEMKWEIRTPDMLMGHKFKPAGRGGASALGVAIDRALDRLGVSVSARDVLSHVRRQDAVVERVDDDESIEWLQGERTKTTAYRSFCNLVSARKKLRKKR